MELNREKKRKKQSFPHIRCLISPVLFGTYLSTFIKLKYVGIQIDSRFESKMRGVSFFCIFYDISKQNRYLHTAVPLLVIVGTSWRSWRWSLSLGCSFFDSRAHTAVVLIRASVQKNRKRHLDYTEHNDATPAAADQSANQAARRLSLSLA